MNKLAFALVLSGLAATLSGCSEEETVSSENIKTAGIAMLVDVTATDDQNSTVRAELLVGGDESNTHVILDNGDKIVASAGGESKTLSAESEGVYEAVFGTAAGGTEFKVELVRPNDTTASDNSGIMVAPFAISGLPTDEPSRATDTVTVEWSPFGDQASAHFKVDGSCIFVDEFDAPDTGSYTFDPGDLKSTGGDNPETCDVTITIQRSRAGSTDPKLDNESHFRLHQLRAASFISAP